mmetsp:Transcript_37303/g.116133  ORF Transcript_37303/g.116133 Transcript_37303/m.116133 type:complete len:105 (+) Transcript_37303:130-444(+)
MAVDVPGGSGEGEVAPARLVWRAVMQRGFHEFQILRDGSWDLRLYPPENLGGGAVVLRPGAGVLPVAGLRGGGHGRNWALEGPPGAAFDVFYDPSAGGVSCEPG